MSPDLPDSPATRRDQFAFLRGAHDGPPVWARQCLKLARSAAQLPPVHPTALAAAYATPRDLRVYDVMDLRRGMVVFYDDPNDSNPAGHVATVAGWVPSHTPTSDLSDLVTVTNDALRPGGVDWVRGDFYPEHWADGFLFGAPCLNGYDLPGFSSGRPQPHGRIDALDQAIALIRKAIRQERADGHTRVVNALVRDLAELRQTRKILG